MPFLMIVVSINYTLITHLQCIQSKSECTCAYDCLLFITVAMYIIFILIGSCHERMSKETERFSSFKQQCVVEGKKEPKGDGALIFDEVKVISHLMWNSRSQRIIGLAMSPEDMSSLHDAYQLVNESTAHEQTSYILQFLWRDLTSSFDVVGPYFTSSSSLESKFITSCVFETLRVFHLYGFHTCALVCDGASSNVSAVKSMCGTSGAYGVNAMASDRHKVEPCFTNPFDPETKIFWVICPSHQVSMHVACAQI